MIDHHHLAPQPGGEPAPSPVEACRPLDPDFHRDRKRHRRLQEREAVQVVGPDIALEPEPRLGIGEVDRPLVAGLAASDLHLCVEPRGGAAPFGRQGQRRIAPTPAMGPQAVGEAVPAEIQPRAGAHLAERERQPASCGNLQEAAEEDRRAGDLVRLRRATEEEAKLLRLRLQGREQRGPHAAIGLAAGGGKLRRQCWGAAGERQIVEAAEQAERKDAALEITVPVGQERKERPGRVDIRGDTLHRLRPERRTELGAVFRLAPERGG